MSSCQKQVICSCLLPVFSGAADVQKACVMTSLSISRQVQTQQPVACRKTFRNFSRPPVHLSIVQSIFASESKPGRSRCLIAVLHDMLPDVSVAGSQGDVAEGQMPLTC